MLYKPPHPYQRLFYEGNESDLTNHSLDILKSQPIWPFVKRHLDSIGNNITDKEYVIAQYDSEIRYADEQVKELLDLLDKLSISNDTTLILTSDHGESMDEHNFYFDHHGVYETTIHVPLIIKNPQYNFKEMRVDDLVQSTICLRPTIVSLFGVQDLNSLEGKNLIRIAEGEDKGTDEIYSNMGVWTAKRAYRRGRWKLIKTLDKSFWDTPDIELFDVISDPQEINDIAKDKPSLVDELELRMERWLKDKIGKKIDPLELIVNNGLPVYYWVETAAEQTGLSKSYEEWRMRVDKAEIS
jgi:arylsulfatase A-like enzyme